VLGRQLGVTLFAWGTRYTIGDGVDTGWVIAMAGFGLVPFAISQLQLFAFYAMPDTRTPALLNLPVAALRIVIDLLLLVILPYAALNGGLMIGNAISFVAAVILGYWLLRRRLGRLGLREVANTLGRLGLAGLVAAVPTYLIALIIEHFLGLGKIGSFLGLVVGCLVLAAVYLATAVGLRVREVSEVWSMVNRRIGR
jgi:putative peptidoglycan lipid II flippase